jgi:hypothetical protein
MPDGDGESAFGIRRHARDQAAREPVEIDPDVAGSRWTAEDGPPRGEHVGGVNGESRRTARHAGRCARAELVREPVGRAARLEREPALSTDEAREAAGRLGPPLRTAHDLAPRVATARAVGERPERLDRSPVGMLDAARARQGRAQRSYTNSMSAIAIRSPARIGLCWITWPFTRVPLRERRSEISIRPARATISAW